MSNYIEIKLQFPAKDSVGLSLKKYMGSDIQLIITNLYKPNQYVILNKEIVLDFDEENMSLTAKIPVDDNYTTDDYKVAGIRLIMKAPLAPEHPLYSKAKKIICSSSFNGGASPETTGVMYDSGNGNTIKWHFVIKTQATDAITASVIESLKDKPYYIGNKEVKDQVNDAVNNAKELSEYHSRNYKIRTIVFTFNTPKGYSAGTDALFNLAIGGMNFYFDAENGREFFPSYTNGGYDSSVIKESNSDLENKGIKCEVRTLEDDGRWVKNRDDTKRFEQETKDKIIITFPEDSSYRYNDFAKSDVTVEMTIEKGGYAGWYFDEWIIELFDGYTCRDRKEYGEGYGYKAGDINWGDAPFVLYSKGDFSPCPKPTNVDVLQYSNLYETIADIKNPILKNYREREGHWTGRRINDSNRKLYGDVFNNKVKNDLTIDEPQIKYRIEPYVRNINEDNINNALSMAIHDPLWMLARQWQFGEFEGNDAGSVILAKLKAKKIKVNKLYNLDNRSQVTNIEDMPLEPMVEALPVEMDWQARVESAHYFLSMLQFNTNITTNLVTLKTELLREFPLEDTSLHTTDNPSAEEHLEQLKTSCKTDLQAYVTNYQNKIFDGYKLYRWCVNHIDKPKQNSETSLLQDDLAMLDLLKEYMAWFEKKYHIEPNKYWKPEALNYRFGVEAPADDTHLVADNYDSGKLSWFSFENDKNIEKTEETENITPVEVNIPGVITDEMSVGLNQEINVIETLPNEHNIIGNIIQSASGYSEKMFTFIPTMARYPGMPKKRLWELESGTVEMGVTTGVGVKHYANALILQYATMYANDWMMLPMELDISTITEVDKVLLTNVFGDRTIVRAKNESNPDERFMNNWEMFTLSCKDPYLNNDFSSDKRMFYPAALYNALESEPVEEIQFLRDEMSNMVWGVENIINQGCGIPLNGKHFAAALKEKIEENTVNPNTQNNSHSENENTNETKNPEYTYTFQNTVPANWIPFIPVRMEKGTHNYHREIRLQRAKMPVYLDNKYVAMQPNTSFLQAGLRTGNYAPLFINEEEIDAVGAKLIRTYQRVRWIGGKTFTWTGYKKQLSGMQANSGLKFDKLEEIEKNEK